eukprot:TRINITY_DN10093_c0_g1_i1.p1 TRINITY_DN10093_c0_g1~~TRINITY_DN10093_c0_g1_i1.p1  ORF type:complete len:130 (-),score=1.20 TRINITY_DN10093_c0_g1_i1:62-415(-)
MGPLARSYKSFHKFYGLFAVCWTIFTLVFVIVDWMNEVESNIHELFISWTKVLLWELFVFYFIFFTMFSVLYYISREYLMKKYEVLKEVFGEKPAQKWTPSAMFKNLEGMDLNTKSD